jgi:uncharacterized membrane protein (DUF2068 family)
MPNPTHPASALRWIGAFKLLKALVLVAVAVELHRLVHQDVAAEVERWVRAIHVDPTGPVGAALLHMAQGATGRKMSALVVVALAYAAVYAVEGVGLLARRRWAEYLTVVSTCLLLPLEVYEIAVHPTVVRVAVLLLNLLIVAYLVWQLRATRDDARRARERKASERRARKSGLPAAAPAPGDG